MPGIKLNKVVKTFGKITALKGINLDIGEGEFFVLVGPTGAGMTTTLRVISGLEKIDSGKIMIGEENAARLSPAERDVAFVYQTFSLYPQTTAVLGGVQSHQGRTTQSHLSFTQEAVFLRNVKPPDALSPHRSILMLPACSSSLHDVYSFVLFVFFVVNLMP